MQRRQNRTANYALCGGLALWGLIADQGIAEVIDLGAGARDLRLRAGVLDFGKEIPARETRTEHNNAAVPKPDPQVWHASYAPTSHSRSPKGSAEIEDLVLSVGQDYLRDPGLKEAGLTGTEWLALFRANIAVESGFNPQARSPVGAIGLGQLMPDTAAALGVDPYDAEDNLRGAARYLLTQLRTFGAPDLALAAYNAGPDAVLKYGGIPPYAETLAHVSKVLRLASSTLIPE